MILLPFCVTGGDGKIHLNMARVTEAVVIAVVGGVIAGILSSKIMLERLDVRVGVMETRVERIEADIYKPKFKQ